MFLNHLMGKGKMWVLCNFLSLCNKLELDQNSCNKTVLAIKVVTNINEDDVNRES